MTEDITMLEKLSERQLRLAMLLSMDSFYFMICQIKLE